MDKYCDPLKDESVSSMTKYQNYFQVVSFCSKEERKLVGILIQTFNHCDDDKKYYGKLTNMLNTPRIGEISLIQVLCRNQTLLS